MMQERSIKPRLCLPVLFAVLLPGSAAADDSNIAKPRSLDYTIVVTGSELLSGVYADGHTHFLTRTLRPLGWRCVGSMCVDDKPADLKAAMRFAVDRPSLVIVTGGLGPTDSDITRQTLAEFTGNALKEHPEVLRQMADRFGVSPEKLRTNMRRQTQVPSRGTYLKNGNGSAVGLVFESDRRVIVALPGPPRELQAMVRDELIPYLSRRFGTRSVGRSMTLRFVGLGQSQINQTLDDHVKLPPNVSISSQFDGSRVDFTFSLPGDTDEDSARLKTLEEAVLQHLGDHVYATDGHTTLEQRVVELLAERDATLALAEVGTGGRLAAAIGGVDKVDSALAGAYVAPTEEKLKRLLRISPRDWIQPNSNIERANMIASVAAEASGGAWVIVVGSPTGEPNGNRPVIVVFRSPDGRFDSRTFRLSGTSDSARSRLATQILDQLRRRLR